jgi:hypothetical protein
MMIGSSVIEILPLWNMPFKTKAGAGHLCPTPALRFTRLIGSLFVPRRVPFRATCSKYHAPMADF